MLNQKVNRDRLTRFFTGRCATRTPFGLLAGVLLFCGLGCHRSPMVERSYTSPWPGISLAIVPFRNQSGSDALDVMAVTDEFYAELQQVQPPKDRPDLVLQVMPVNRVLATLDEMGLENVYSPESAYQLANTLNVDGVIVGSVTRYDPYPPPQMGMALQLYLKGDLTPKSGDSDSFNPGDLARAGNPVDLPAGPVMRPQAQVIRIFDAHQDAVMKDVRDFAQNRGTEQSPYGWKKMLTSRNYVRFVCHQMVGELLALERRRVEHAAVPEAP